MFFFQGTLVPFLLFLLGDIMTKEKHRNLHASCQHYDFNTDNDCPNASYSALSFDKEWLHEYQLECTYFLQPRRSTNLIFTYWGHFSYSESTCPKHLNRHTFSKIYILFFSLNSSQTILLHNSISNISLKLLSSQSWKKSDLQNCWQSILKTESLSKIAINYPWMLSVM